MNDPGNRPETSAERHSRLIRVETLCRAQARDADLWTEPETAAEALLQIELRKLHRVVAGESLASTHHTEGT